LQIRKIVYLVHSMVYEASHAADPELCAENNDHVYLERELACEKLWRQAIAQFSEDTAFAQLYGGRQVFEFAQNTLGGSRALWVSADYEPGMDPEVYRERLAAALQRQLDDCGHKFDPASLELEVWGESFEGCAYGYGTALARHLALKHPPFGNFDLSVPSRLLCKSRLREHNLIPGSAARGYVFDGPLGYPMGLFMNGFLAPPESDSPVRYVRLKVDPRKVMITTAAGMPLHANLHVFRKDQQIPVKPTFEHPDIRVAEDALELPLDPCHYIHALNLSPDSFAATMRNAELIGVASG
jgi:hypothetical protein